MLFFLVYQLLRFLVALSIIHKARLLTQGISKDIRVDVVAVAAGEAVVSVNPGLPGPRLLRRQILINQLALKTALSTLAEFAEQAPLGDSGFCDYRLASGLLVELQAKYWAEAATPGQVLVPIAPAIGLPLLISGIAQTTPACKPGQRNRRGAGWTTARFYWALGPCLSIQLFN
ncbi:MAG: hypothetical protein JKX92_05525 [Porticoccaceae bacterium]|nr:hypothetical protein [Porticoccaceae bacterium]